MNCNGASAQSPVAAVAARTLPPSQWHALLRELCQIGVKHRIAHSPPGSASTVFGFAHCAGTGGVYSQVRVRFDTMRSYTWLCASIQRSMPKSAWSRCEAASTRRVAAAGS
jgi:hypothetical protein